MGEFGGGWDWIALPCEITKPKSPSSCAVIVASSLACARRYAILSVFLFFGVWGP